MTHADSDRIGAGPASVDTDHELVRDAARDYFEGWFDGDAERMDRALHTEFVKREGADELGIETKEEMVERTRLGLGKRDTGREIDVEVVEVYGRIATAVVRSAPYREYLHLVRTADGWKIANALYART